MGCQPTGPFRGSLMTPQGRGVVRVKADQRGCGASGQDKAHKSEPFSEEAIFFFPLAIWIKIQSQSSHCAPPPPLCKGCNSKPADRLGFGVNKVVYFRLSRISFSCHIVGNWPADQCIKVPKTAVGVQLQFSFTFTHSDSPALTWMGCVIAAGTYLKGKFSTHTIAELFFQFSAGSAFHRCVNAGRTAAFYSGNVQDDRDRFRPCWPLGGPRVHS